MNIFSSYHPVVLMLYFISVILVSMFTLHPVILTISLISGICWFSMLADRRELLSSLGFYLAMFILIAVTNPIFSHNGETILFFLNDQRVTLEAIFYGMATGVMIVAVIFWCKCYSEVMTSDKFIYLFGKAIPKLSLILSMALRFIPLFKMQMKKISKTQKTMGLYSSKSVVDNIGGAMRVFAAILTWSLENAVDTANSMKARGYGLKGRTNFSLFRFTYRDGIMLGCIASGMFIIAVSAFCGKLHFAYYPVVTKANGSVLGIVAYIMSAVLMFIPYIIEIKENIRWKLLISKI